MITPEITAPQGAIILSYRPYDLELLPSKGGISSICFVLCASDMLAVAVNCAIPPTALYLHAQFQGSGDTLAQSEASGEQ